MLDKTSKALFKYLFRQLNDGKKLFALSEIINLFNEEINDTNVRSYLLNIEREGFIDIIFTAVELINDSVSSIRKPDSIKCHAFIESCCFQITCVHSVGTCAPI